MVSDATNLVVLVVFIIALFAIVILTSSSGIQASAISQFNSTACNPSLWMHVWSPARLHLVNPCIAVNGTIDYVQAEPDGDYHVGLKLDMRYAGLVNNVNFVHLFNDLLLEPVCQHQITEQNPSATTACMNFTSQVSIPAVGTHVQVIGSYVLDTNHGWMEIHPATSIKTIP